MKKIFMIPLILFALISAGIPIQVRAANELTFSLGSVGNAERGQTITVPVIVGNNPGFTTVGLVVTYDLNVLEITGVTAPIAAMPLNSQFALTTTPGTQWISLINTSLMDWNGNGTVVNITFNVKSNAPLGTSAINLAFTNTPDGSPVNAGGVKIVDVGVFSRNINVAAGNNDGWSGSGGSGSGGTSTTPTPTTTPEIVMPTTESSVPITIPNETATTGINNADGLDDNSQLSDDGNDGDEMVDNGGFFGVPYDDTGLGNTTTGLNESSDSAGTISYGIVPQTGVLSIMGAIVGMCVSFAASVVLYIYILRRRYMRHGNGKA